MENIREHKDIKLVNTRSKLNKYVREPNIKTIKYFSENLLAVEMRKTEITMNKPVYLGQEIFDIRKTLMYQFYYFIMIMLNLNTMTNLNCATWILIVLYYIFLLKSFTKISVMM